MSRINKDGGFVRRPGAEDEQSEVRERRGTGSQAPATTTTTEAPPPRTTNAVDAERLVSQAGFARTQSKKGGVALDLGERGKGPIPLPEDDVDLSDWSIDTLAAAQSQLLQHNAKLGRHRAKGRERGLLGALLGIAADDSDDHPRDDADKEERAAQLRAIAEQAPPDAAAMAALAESVRKHFGVDVDGASVGETLVATSLLVAGHQESVAAAEGGGAGLAADRLMGGLQQVVEEGRSAADDARQRSEGVSRALAFQRTFVPRR